MSGKRTVKSLNAGDGNTNLPSWFCRLPDSALIRLNRIIDFPKNAQPLVCVSASTWWRWVSSKRAPQPVRPSAGTTLWRVSDLRAWLSDPASYTLKVNGSRKDKTSVNCAREEGV